MIENGREAAERAGSSGKSQEGNQDGGVHDMLAEIFLFGGETKDQKDETEPCGDQSGMVGGTGKNKTGQTKEDVGEGETDGDIGHKTRMGESGGGGKTDSRRGDLAQDAKCGKIHECRLSSVVEQRFCKPLVVGSNPTAGSIIKYLSTTN